VALFVDASADPGSPAPPGRCTPRRRRGRRRRCSVTRSTSPALLALTARLHGRVPAAATLALPARDFGLGERLTPTAADAVRVAVEALAALAAG
jgi:hypothetical protein